MPYESVKCPSCGAPIQVDTNIERCFCSSCGNQISVVAAVKKLLVDAKVDGISTIQNFLMLGEQCLEVLDWKEAESAFSSAIDRKVDSFDAWYGLLKAITKSFSQYDIMQIRIEGLKGLASAQRNCDKYVPPDQKYKLRQEKIMLTEIWNTYLDEIKRTINSRSIKNSIAGFLFVPILILFFVGVGDMMSMHPPTRLIFAFIILVLSLGLLHSSGRADDIKRVKSEMIEIEKRIATIRPLLEFSQVYNDAANISPSAN